MRHLLFYSLLLGLSSCFVKSKSVNLSDTYFVKNKMYHYNTLYIDEKGDTVIKGKLLVKPLDKSWIFQSRVQEAVDYIHINDTTEFNKYKDPDTVFYQSQQKYYEKHGSMKMVEKERTGGYLSDSNFYIHPPRTNQFRMLSYATHPIMNYNFLQDSVMYMVQALRLPYFGTIYHKYQIEPLETSSLRNIRNGVRVWQVMTKSKIEFTNEDFKQNPIYNSTLDAEFCKEYGFIKMHYTFENGIKIQFDFEKMTEE